MKPVAPGKGRAFTLIEILLVVALVGIVLVVGIAPMFRTTQIVTSLEEEFGESSAMRLAASRMAIDVRQIGRCPKGAPFRLIRHDRFGGEADDVVIAWTSTPSGSPGRIPGSLVYRLVWADQRSELSGLYRWFFPGVVPEAVDPDLLVNNEMGLLDRGDLVLPGVAFLRIEVHDGGTWVGQYQGPSPFGIKLEMTRSKERMTYVDWLPR